MWKDKAQITVQPVTFFNLNTTEQEIYPAQQLKNAINCAFEQDKYSIWVFLNKKQN